VEKLLKLKKWVAGRKLEDVIKHFHEYCNPHTSIVLNRFQFHNSSQSGDTIDVYLMKLQRLAEGCEFGNQRYSMIKDKLLFGMNVAGVFGSFPKTNV